MTMTTSANIIQALFGDDADDDDANTDDDNGNNNAEDSEDIVVENASKPASSLSSSSSSSSLCCWENTIGIIEDVLTIEDCNELIAVHESDPHQGFIEQLTLTRISDLVPLCNNDNNNDNANTTTASFFEEASPSTTAAELLLVSKAASSEAAAASLSSLVHLTLPLIRARAIMWQAVEQYYGPSVQYELVPEFTSLTGWHQGSYLKNHYDSNREYLKDRYYSAILYLNDPTINDNDNDNPKLRRIRTIVCIL